MNLDTLQPRGATMLPTRDALENRPYVHQPYPSTRFHPDGRAVTVADEAAAQALGEPWASTPYPPPPVVVPPPEPTVAELKESLLACMQQNEEMKVRCASQAAEIAELRAQLSAAEEIALAKKKTPKAP